MISRSPWLAASCRGRYGSRVDSALLVETPIDLRDLGNPTPALGMVQCQNLPLRPVKVIGNVRYLLIEPL
jgi:hypothetical protein